MEALAAFGLAANIAQFAELGYKTAKTMREVYRSIDGLTAEHTDFKDAAKQVKAISTELKKKVGTVGSNSELEGLLQKSIDACDALLKEVDGLKFDGGSAYVGERLAKLMMAMWAIRRKRKVEALNSRIVEIRQRLLLAIQNLILEQGGEVMQSLDGLSDTVKQSQEWHKTHAALLDTKLQELGSQLAARKSWEKSHDDAFMGFSRSLVNFVDQWRNHSTISEILKSLHFKQLRERQSDIPTAHKNTFQWMFNDDGGKEFRTWLGGPSKGTFWITGKAGSGKSTLIKFLLEHPETKRLLEQWATSSAHKPLLLVSHFFWSRGGKLQRAHEGLLRTMLFQILVAHPELIKKVCPQRFLPFRCLDSWTFKELRDVFGELAKINSLPSRIFVFVDGLDEFEGEPAEIIDAVREISSCGDIKLCCSSRPWTQFEEAFESAAGRINVHQLTENDIRRYVDDCFGDDHKYQNLCREAPSEASNLVEAVASRAEGVFFWVFLVVKDLLRGLDHGDSLKIMRQRLDRLPSDLNEFFATMLQSIEGVYHDEASLIFQCLLVFDSALPVALFTAMHELEELFEDLKRGAFFGNLGIQSNTTPQSNWARRKRAQGARPPVDPYPKYKDAENSFGRRMQRSTAYSAKRVYNHDELQKTAQRIRHRCRDLVQVWDSTEETELWRPRVGFIHRTVVDFLSASDSHALLPTSNPPGYRDFVLARSYLQCAMVFCQSSEVFCECIKSVLYLAADDDSDRAIFVLFGLERLFHILLSDFEQNSIIEGSGAELESFSHITLLAGQWRFWAWRAPKLYLTKIQAVGSCPTASINSCPAANINSYHSRDFFGPHFLRNTISGPQTIAQTVVFGNAFSSVSKVIRLQTMVLKFANSC
ncbi:hypothetical protein GGTG_02130 [Gaeumannomyces tritici R3-111a-1]|uniref:Uncharacterized protein n=1 Tax=Gaeumannomyces tritici (strain R3-111a-1) TaxID=644352 RepID=J3NLI1_GAET3|nr:hypothetical protein GGTG_02130 [Gaeumannomyces tritici R3-111a-1]EJT82156.1 hypothetical protein GGTG_02130 [Gaeumannomyces tritici R3-111a-1]